MPIQLKEYLALSPYFIDTDKTPGFNWEKFQDKIDGLPDPLFFLMTDEKTSAFIQSLTQKYVQLSAQGPDVARLIRDVVIADVFIGDMPAEISRRLGVDSATAREIANLIVSQIFAPVLEDLKKVHNEKYPGRLPRQNFAPQNLGGQAPKPAVPNAPQPQSPKYQGEELPESGGNIIDLRSKS